MSLRASAVNLLLLALCGPVGIADYTRLGPLPGARADVLAMELRLQALGFRGSRELDVADKADLEDRVLPEFRRKIEPGDLDLLYCSGHGLAYGSCT